MASSSDAPPARIDGHIKEEVTNMLTGMGFSVSDAVQMLLTRDAADKALPFDINRAQSQSDTHISISPVRIIRSKLN